MPTKALKPNLSVGNAIAFAHNEISFSYQAQAVVIKIGRVLGVADHGDWFLTRSFFLLFGES